MNHLIFHSLLASGSDSLRVACRLGQGSTMSFLQSKITLRDNFMARTSLVFAFPPELSMVPKIKLVVIFTFVFQLAIAQDEVTTVGSEEGSGEETTS